MSDVQKFPPSAAQIEAALIDKNGYETTYQTSIDSNDAFWAEHGKRIDWIKPYSIISNNRFDKPNVQIKWYEDGTLNAAANCLDRHLKTKATQTAIIWEGDEPGTHAHISYQELYEKTCRFANALKTHGVKKGDRGDYIYAYDTRSGDRYAGLRAYWGGTFRRVWRILTRRAGRAYPRLCI